MIGLYHITWRCAADHMFTHERIIYDEYEHWWSRFAPRRCEHIDLVVTFFGTTPHQCNNIAWVMRRDQPLQAA